MAHKLFFVRDSIFCKKRNPNATPILAMLCGDHKDDIHDEVHIFILIRCKHIEANPQAIESHNELERNPIVAYLQKALKCSFLSSY